MFKSVLVLTVLLSWAVSAYSEEINSRYDTILEKALQEGDINSDKKVKTLKEISSQVSYSNRLELYQKNEKNIGYGFLGFAIVLAPINQAIFKLNFSRYPIGVM